MNRSNLGRFVIVLLVVAWSVSELYPPTPRYLVDVFDQQSSTPDKNFDEIVKKARELDSVNATRAQSITYSNLVVAIGTNDIRRYFPTNYVNLAVERDPVRGILNKVFMHDGESCEPVDPLVQVVDISRGYFVGNVEEKIGRAFTKGQQVELRLQTGPELAPVTGTISFVSPQSSLQNTVSQQTAAHRSATCGMRRPA